MQNIVSYTTSSGRKVNLKSEDGNWWIQDYATRETFFLSRDGGGFQCLDDGEAFHAFRSGTRVTEENLLADLQEAKNLHIDVIAKAS